MKTILLIIALTTISFAQVTQEWAVNYNGPGNGSDVTTDIIVDNDGNVYVTGYSYTGVQGGQDLLIIKYNSAGVQQWEQRYNGPGNSTDEAVAITLDNNGNVIVTGRSIGVIGAGFDYVTIKYSPDGTQQWVQRYDNDGANTGDEATDIAVDQNGNVYVTGKSGSGGATSFDYATIKYNSIGVQQWVQRYHFTGDYGDIANAIAIDNSGNVYVTGQSGKAVGNQDDWDCATIKYNSNGVQQWVNRYSGATDMWEKGIDIALDNLGNIYVLGQRALFNNGESGRDFLTIKYNANGSKGWERIYNGSANLEDFPTSLAIDNNNDVIVAGISQNDVLSYEAKTIKYNYSGDYQWENQFFLGGMLQGGVSLTTDATGNCYVTSTIFLSTTTWRDIYTVKYTSGGTVDWFIQFNSQGIQNDYSSAITIDNTGNVYVTGYTEVSINPQNYDYVTIKYSQGITITEPQAGEKWIAGEPDTIRWRGPKENGWEIFISDDDGFSYNSLNVILPADDSMFVWTPPDSLETSSYYRIKVIDVLNNNLFAESEQFTIRAYDLVRLTSEGKYEVYKPSLHGWSVVNYVDYIWPPSWYNQYDYRTGEDPFTLQPYYNKFVILTRAESSDFPDWPTFVETFGVEKCYETSFISGNPYQPKQRAMEAWSTIKMDYGGACFGFPSSALLAFEQSAEFFSQNQLLEPTPTIFFLNSLIPIRKTIIKYFLYQSDSTSIAYSNDKFTISVRETLEEIKEMLMNDDGPHSILSLQPPVPGGHAVIPHKLMKDPVTEGQYKLFVYDPNSPGENRELILLDSLGNTWQEFLDLDYGISSDGLFLGLPITHFLQVPIFKLLEKSNNASSKKDAGALAELSSVSLYTQTKSDLIILSDNGDSLGYVGGNLIRKMANAGPIIPVVGGFTSPIGYVMPAGNYSLWQSQFKDSLSSILFSENGILYRYERSNPLINQIDKFTLGNGFAVFSDEEKEILLRTIGGNNKEIVYELSNITIMAGDSLRTIHSPDDDLLVSNKGNNKMYDLRVQQLDTYQAIDFEHSNISLSENTTHYLSLVDSLLTSIRILIDIGNDGTIDDTLYVANTVEVKDEVNLLSPNEYNLAQNYPNPFNPTTTIQYSIPQRSDVTLKVYDVLGNEVATLVNEEKDRGVYSVNFDASELSSGIYFYRLQASSFVETKKMILIK